MLYIQIELTTTLKHLPILYIHFANRYYDMNYLSGNLFHRGSQVSASQQRARLSMKREYNGASANESISAVVAKQIATLEFIALQC